MDSERAVCPHCGALQRDGGSVCELCGSSMTDEGEAIDGQARVTVSSSAMLPPEVGVSQGTDDPSARTSALGVPITIVAGGFCTSCGAPYPKDARFCGSCGRKIATVEISNPVDAKDDDVGDSVAPSTDRELGRQIMIVVGAGALLVVGLFFVTIASKTNDAQPVLSRKVALEMDPAPLPPEAAATESRIVGELAALSGAEKRNKREELIDFYLAQNRTDLAAIVQDSIANNTRTEIDVRTGNLYYDWMESVEGPERTLAAKKAIAAYSRALEINPANHDVRTDMAIAYMYDSDNPMQAILQTNQVLSADPEHVQANFNKGIMLLRISRYDKAEAQFERVKSIIGDSTNQIYQRAEAALNAVAQLRAG